MMMIIIIIILLLIIIIMIIIRIMCGASSRKPYNVGEKIFIFLADLNSPDSKL